MATSGFHHRAVHVGSVAFVQGMEKWQVKLVNWLRQRPQNAPRWVGFLTLLTSTAGARLRVKKYKGLEQRIAALELARARAEVRL